MKRYGMVIRLRPEKEEEYKQLHAHPWAAVSDMIRRCSIHNYSIFLQDGFLYSYWEYVGDDFDADMARMAQDPVTQAWWRLTDPCQEPVKGAATGEKWSIMEEVFHLD